MASIGKQQLTQGWYITGGITVGIALGNTKLAPFVLGILSIALIYQLSLLVEGIPPVVSNTTGPLGAAGAGAGAAAGVSSNTGSTPVTFA